METTLQKRRGNGDDIGGSINSSSSNNNGSEQQRGHLRRRVESYPAAGNDPLIHHDSTSSRSILHRDSESTTTASAIKPNVDTKGNSKLHSSTASMSHDRSSTTERVTTTASTTAAVNSSESASTTIKLLTELEKSWAMFAAKWKVVELFAGTQIWQEQLNEGEMEPLNSMLFQTCTTGLIAFVAGSIGSSGVVVSSILAFIVVFGMFWSKSAYLMKRPVPSFRIAKAIDGSPNELFEYIMDIRNLPLWDPSVEKGNVIHKIDENSDIIHIVFRPTWVWPIWITPRDLCLLRYWRMTENGTYIICMQSSIHPECPPTHGIVRGICNGGGFTIAPKHTLSNGAIGLNSLVNGEEKSSLVTHVVHLDPQGWEGEILRRFNAILSFVRPQVLALTGLEEIMEARKYSSVNIAEEFSAIIAAAEDYGEINTHTSQGGNSNGSNGSSTSTGSSDNSKSSSRAYVLKDFSCVVPRSMWCEPEHSAMLVRGPDYLTDRRKVPSAPPVFRLVGVDLFESSKALENISSRSDNIVQKEIKRHEAEGTEMPFTFVINFLVPGTPRLSLVLYYQAPNPSVMNDDSPFADLMADFLDGTDEYRNERFKLIPCIVEGSFIVRQAVGSTPAIIGTKLRQPYYRGKNYFELDVDIASSAVANRVVGLVTGYTKKLVIDMGFLLEGQSQGELPERLFGSCRLLHIDLGLSKKLPDS